MSLPSHISVLFFGDVIGKPGRRVVTDYLRRVDPKPHLIIANVENIAHGFGVTEKNLEELSQAGVQIFSGGNHTFDRREIFDFIDRQERLLRPANYPEGTPGRGWCLIDVGPAKVAVINLMGRVFMEPLVSPFLLADQIIEQVSQETNLIIVDMHAEATAEKVAMGWYLNGKVSAVLGTHTHVQTADERILPGGTAYITDAGCCGPADGVIGMERSGAFRKMIKQLPSRLEVAPGPAMLNGVSLTLNLIDGHAVSIARIHWREEDEGETAIGDQQLP